MLLPGVVVVAIVVYPVAVVVAVVVAVGYKHKIQLATADF